jgi:tripartite-type tricarboxylate transporter receptor subunit TctC
MVFSSRRKFLSAICGVAALPAVQAARAQTYPSRSVVVLVGYAAGGPTDICARLISEALSRRLGQQFVVDNRPGAGGNIATEAAVRAPADGYTLLLVSTSNAINKTLYRSLNFNFVEDIEPVAGIMQLPSVMEVNPSVPVDSVPDFIAYAKARPGKLNLGTAGNGSPPHIFAELFMAMTGVDLTVVGYRGGEPALVDLLAGQVQVMFEGITSTIGYLKAGKLRPLAVTSAARALVLPGVPTIGEYVPGYAATGWFGLGVPKNTPKPIIELLDKTVNESLADPALKARLADLGAQPMPTTQAEFGKFIADETDKWAKVIRTANIKLD